MVNKLFIRFIISLIFSVYGCLVYGQQLPDEPAGGMDDNELEDAEVMPTLSNPAMPFLLNTAPLNLYYSNWDTLCVRRNSEMTGKINDSVSLPLFSGYSTGFVFPIEGKILSPFGYRGRRVHAGVDIKLENGDPVSAAFDGVVRLARCYRGYGNCVVVRHFNGIETLYGHLSKIQVHVNQAVKAGDIVGLGGHTGRASCTHLHFETRFQGKAFNPRQIINFDSYALEADTFTVTKATFGLTRDYLPVIAAVTDSTQKDKSVTTTAKSKAKVKKTAAKYHTVKNGDTLGAISRKYGTTVNQLCSINGIKKTKILKLGSKIRVK